MRTLVDGGQLLSTEETIGSRVTEYETLFKSTVWLLSDSFVLRIASGTVGEHSLKVLCYILRYIDKNILNNFTLWICLQNAPNWSHSRIPEHRETVLNIILPLCLDAVLPARLWSRFPPGFGLQCLGLFPLWRTDTIERMWVISILTD